jgi:hypothetical protein
MWLGQDETMQGFGCAGGCHGIDGHLYQWVQGVDGLGNPVGYWRQAGTQPAGSAYVRNMAPVLGNVAQDAQGQLYQWVQGVDGLGNAFGFWKRLRRLAKRALPIARQIAPFVPGASAALTAATPFLRHAGISGMGDVGALYAAPDGSLYQVDGIGADDTLDAAEDDELRGLSDDELRGLSDDELSALAADEELQGFGADEELNGFGADEDLSGVAAADVLDGLQADELEGLANGEPAVLSDTEMEGLAQEGPTLNGYVRDAGMNGVEGYAPDGPPQTPMFAPAPNAPMWAPLW